MPIICFSGFKGSGKDTCANYLIEKHNAIRVALADPLKDMVAEEYGIDRSSLDDPNRKESPILTMPVDPKDAFTRMIAEFMFKEFAFSTGEKAINFSYERGKFYGDCPNGGAFVLYWTPRALAILKGSVNRAVNPNFWTDKAFGVMEGELNENPNQLILVTDVRYKSEVSKFKERFGDKVTFVRVNRHKKSTSSDPSEIDLVDAKFDFYVDNTGSLEETFCQIERFISSS